MTRIKTIVFVLGTALALLVPAVAQAQSVVVNNTSSTQSTSTASTPGQSASTTTSGVGATGVIVAGGVDNLGMDSTGSSTSAAIAGPTGASASGNSTNTSDIDLDCGSLQCTGTFNCVGVLCTPTIIGGGTILQPNPGFTFIPIPQPTLSPTTNCTAGLLGCLLSNPDIALTDVLDLGDVLNDLLTGSPVLTDLLNDLDIPLTDVLNGLLGGGVLSGGGLLG